MDDDSDPSDDDENEHENGHDDDNDPSDPNDPSDDDDNHNDDNFIDLFYYWYLLPIQYHSTNPIHTPTLVMFKANLRCSPVVHARSHAPLNVSLHPGRLTAETLRIQYTIRAPWKRKIIFQTIIFRFSYKSCFLIMILTNTG